MSRIQKIFIYLLSFNFIVCGAIAQTSADTWGRLDYKPYSVIPNLSFMNEKPAGLRGRVFSKGPDLIFGDGTPARFWGANLQAYALFSTSPYHIRAQARRLAALGFNLVRMHHHDSDWVRPNVFDSQSDTTRTLSSASMKLLDLWIEALKAEGIYIWLDLHVGRRMLPGDDIELFDEIAKEKDRADIRGFNFISPSIRSRMLEFQQAFLSHENHVSGLRYKDDPAIIAVLITNENDLTHHFGNRLLPDKKVPLHNENYMYRAKAFAEEHGLDPERTWRSWEHGPSKIFLNDLEHRFFAAMTEDIRQAGFEGLIVPTNFWGNMPVSSLPSLSNGSLIDAHSYGSPSELTKSPITEGGMLAWIASGQVAGMPLSISEWNTGTFPVDDRFILPLRMATLAAHQGWDALMIYGYSQQPLNGPLRPSNWSVASDPAVMATLPASALLFRQAHVRQARNTYAIRLSVDQFFESEVSPRTSAAIRTLYEQSAVVIEIPRVPELSWLEPRRAPDSAIPVEDPNRSFLEEDATSVYADTGDFSRDFSKGVFKVNTEKTQLIAGAMGGDEIHLEFLSLRIDQPIAVVVVQSLDDAPIDHSENILISLTARMQPLNNQDSIYLIEPMSGEIRLRSSAGLKLKDLKGNLLPFTEDNGLYMIDLAKVSGRSWLKLER